jgi:uncharacterized protein (TIGR03435 family)
MSGAVALLLALPFLGEMPATPQTFEVATVKIVRPEVMGPNRVVRRPGRLRYTQAYMSQILTRAFQVQVDQMVAPDWAKSQDGPDRFEIVAKVPVTASDEEVNVMMVQLLKERFHLAYHLGKRQFDVYELVVSKGGPKLHTAEVPTEPPVALEGVARKPLGRDGYPDLVPGWPTAMGAGDNGNMYLSLDSLKTPFFPVFPRATSPAGDLGLIRFSFRMVTIPQFLRALQSIVRIPHAVDQTGLQGTYDVKIAFSLGTGGPRADGDASEPGVDIFHALETQLGLQLRKTKATLDVIEIDHIDRTPVEN